ncbi:YfhO family protein [Pedobacter psychrodurus]|uniref:YfhO family protein n=1 Tax=Pedobacter psychrodurus TaxID=2530456 RepID=UPI00292CE654|nr:YfhO family protein [Pedobacter psychrodurus]
MMKNWFSKNSTHILIVFLLFVICFLFFSPSFMGKTLGQNDVTRAQSTQTEINRYKEKGETILWTNQIHGGMPTFQIWAPYPANITTWIVKVISYAMPAPTGIFMVLLLGTYLLFCVLKINPWLSFAGALAFGFSSYNIILIGAGHSSQIFAIAFFAPVIAGIILIFRKEYLVGTILLSTFLAMEIRANHIQMTYYLMLAILLFVLIECYKAIRAKAIPVFFKSVGFSAAATILAVLVNTSSLWSTYEYGKETIRGTSELSATTTKKTTGLPRDYAYEWSQGVGECITFLIPNAYGGSSRPSTSPESNLVKSLKTLGADDNQALGIAQSMPALYWGEKPFTEGSFYFGAIIVFFFVLGLFIVKSSIKWWLLSVIVLTMLLSFGKNWPYLSDLFFYHVPLYNKFRAVESILAVAGLCFPMLAILSLQEVINSSDKKLLLKKVFPAFYITAGFTLLIAVIPTLFLSFKSANHNEMLGQIATAFKIGSPEANTIGNALVEDRKSLAQSDAIRTLAYIIAAFALLWLYLKDKLSLTVFPIAIAVIVLIDLYTVDKRYVNKESFVAKSITNTPEPRAVDLEIWKDTDVNYKVIDLTKDILSDATTPYFHKSIGGYSAARLKKFNEIVEIQFSKGVNPNILGMLNTKYIITSDSSQQLRAMANPAACGNAWFVNHITFVKNADAEMKALGNLDPKKEVIINEKYSNLINKTTINNTLPNGEIKLTSYSPDTLVYESNSPQTNTAVFSEIYYNKGWKMFIDGIEKPYFSVNYILRGAQIAAGKHKIEFVFHPASYYVGEKISFAASLILVLLIGAGLYVNFGRVRSERR